MEGKPSCRERKFHPNGTTTTAKLTEISAHKTSVRSPVLGSDGTALDLVLGEVYGGETGIRTLDTLRYTRFPSVRLQPLGHLSAPLPRRQLYDFTTVIPVKLHDPVHTSETSPG